MSMSRYEESVFGGSSNPCTRPSRIVMQRISKSTWSHFSARSSLGRIPVKNAAWSLPSGRRSMPKDGPLQAVSAHRSLFL